MKLRIAAAGFAVGLAILTGCASAPANPAAHYTAPPSPSYTQGTAADYLNWDAIVQPDINELGKMDLSQPNGCPTALGVVLRLQSDPLPPVGQTDWTAFLTDAQTGLAACVNKDMATETTAINAMQQDTARWVVDTRTAFPEIFASASASAL